VKLYNSTGGDNWTDKTGWLTGPISTWYGVGLSGNRVISVDLHNNNLIGAWPISYMNYLDAMKYLNLSGNAMTGEILYYVQNFLALTDLYLQNNDFSGTLPPSIGSLFNLKMLDLSGNQLSGNAPIQLKNLSSLMDISLEDNQLNYVPDLSNLEWLHGVSVQNNQLDFYSIEPMVGNITEFYYSPQDSVGTAESRLLREGDALSGFSASVDGSYNEYQWFHDEVEIDGATSYHYYKSSSTAEDAGEYTVHITNTVATDLTLFRRPITVTFYTLLQLDSLALVDLYNDVNGSSWFDQTNWLTAVPLTNWYGVTVAGDRVTDLNLSGNNLSGALPASIVDLTQLDTLNLAANQLSGAIPAELGSLTSLTALHLNANQFSGAVPTEFDSLVSLTYLYLNHNQLDQLHDLSALTALTWLAIEDNRFTFEDIVPNAGVSSFTYTPQDSVGAEQWRNVGEGAGLTMSIPVGGTGNAYQWYKDDVSMDEDTSDTYVITSATTADAGDYELEVTNTGAELLTIYSRTIHVEAGFTPMEVDSLALVDLYNSTTGLDWVLTNPVTSWSGVTVTEGRVTELYFNNYGLTGYLPPALGDLTQLTILRASHNNFTGTLPAEIDSLKRLTYLDLSYNYDLTGPLPAEIGGLDSLVTLKLSWCAFTGAIPPDIGNLAKLTELNLYGNQLTGDIPAAIGSLTQLTTLDLGNNQLTSLPATISSLVNLTRLALYNNQLTSIPTAIGGLTSLTGLYLGGNQLTSVPATIGSLSGLQYLYLENNQLTTVPDAFGGLAGLMELSLSGNQLTGVLPNWIGNLTNLTRLYLQGNQFSGTIPTWIGTLANLTHLNLEGNQLTGAVPAQIGDLGSLADLNLKDNRLEDMPDLSQSACVPLQYLRIQNNRFTFEDIVPDTGITTYRYYYTPQDSVGTEQDTTLIEGSGLAYSVAVGGAGNVYHWARNGVDLAGQDTTVDQLSLPTLTPDDAGDYILHTTNPGAPDLAIYSRPLHVVVVDTSAPAVPQGLAAVKGPGDGEATLTWRANSEGDFLRYRVYGGTAPSLTTLLDSTDAAPDTTVTLAGLELDVIHYFRITALDTSGNESAYSSQVSAIPENFVAPNPPVGLAAVKGPGDGEATITWRANSEADFLRYRVYGGTAPSLTTLLDSTDAALDTAVTLAGLELNIAHYFRLTALDTAGNESAWSSQVSAIPENFNPPDPPAGVAALANSSEGTVIITWRPSSAGDFLRYRVYGDTTANPAIVLDSTAAALDTTVTLAGLLLDKPYYFRVTAADTVGNESASDGEVSAVPLNLYAPAPPEGLAVAAEGGSVTLTWRQNSEGDFLRYRVYGDTTASPTTLLDSTETISDTTKILQVDADGSTYTFHLTAVDAAFNESGPSAAASITPEDITPPATPQILAAEGGPGSVILTWDQSPEPDVQRYRVYGGLTAETLDLMDSTASRADTTATITGLTKWTEYAFKVAAVDYSMNESDLQTYAAKATALNSPPVALDDSATTAEDTAVTIVVLANDTDVDGDPFIIDISTPGKHGSAYIGSGATIVYTPYANFNGRDTLSYYVYDNTNYQADGRDSATVFINVTAVNDAPAPFPHNQPHYSYTLPITGDNVADSLLMSWNPAADVDGDTVRYSLYFMGELAIMPSFSDTAATQVKLPHQAIADSLKAHGQPTIAGYWTVLAYDREDTTWADNESYLTIDASTLDIFRWALLPEHFALHQNHPNPFNPATTLRFDLPEASDVTLLVYDLLGREVTRLVAGRLEPGYHAVVWNGLDRSGRQAPTGVYIARMVSAQYTRTIKLVLLK